MMSDRSDGAVSRVPHARVNLLPAAARLRIRERQRCARWVFVNVTALIILLVAWNFAGGSFAQMQADQHQQNMLRSRVAREQRIGAGLHERAAALAAEVQSLEVLRGDDQWSQRLALLASAVPDGMVLKEVSVPAPAAAPRPRGGRGRRDADEAAAATPPAPQITIVGLASGHAQLAAMLRRIEETRAFQSVRLVKSETATVGSAALVEFELSVTR